MYRVPLRKKVGSQENVKRCFKFFDNFCVFCELGAGFLRRFLQLNVDFGEI